MAAALVLTDAVIVESFTSSSQPNKTYCEIRSDGSVFNVQSSEFDLTSLPKLEKLEKIQLHVVGRVFRGERGPVQALYVQDVAIG